MYVGWVGGACVGCIVCVCEYTESTYNFEREKKGACVCVGVHVCGWKSGMYK